MKITFADLDLHPQILKAVSEEGYEHPTPIQIQAIPVVLEGKDILGGAGTGTGKTAAFVLPILHMLKNRPDTVRPYGCRVLMLAPTRELAAQIEESVRVYGKYCTPSFSSAVIFGGVGRGPQVTALKKGVDVLVATPGRLLDLNQQGCADLAGVKILVLDEADRMLDMGFIHDIRKVLALMPKNKQSLLFSATFSDEIRDLAHKLLLNPVSVQVTPPNTTVQLIEQSASLVGRNRKLAALVKIIKQNNWSQVLVFMRTKARCNDVASALTRAGIKALALHGNKSQTARTVALSSFKSGAIRALIATDIAARGIDIDDLPHVVNYEVPHMPEDYVHRIGRTGRAGQKGEAVTLYCLDEEGWMLNIEKFTKQSISRNEALTQEFGPEPEEHAGSFC